MPTLLIVRPEARAREDRETCRRAGWDALVFSPVEIEKDEASTGRLKNLYANADVVFWVSPTAVETAAPHLDFSDGRKVQVTVGQASRRTLAKYCKHEIVAPEDGHDSEAVLRLPVWKNMPQGTKILIVRGHGGRNYLGEQLRKKGFATGLAEVYYRQDKKLNWQGFKTDDVKAAYITSAELVQLFFKQIPSEFARFFKTLLYFTHHPRVASALRAAGAENVKVVAALDAAVLADAVQPATPRQTADQSSEKPVPQQTAASDTDKQAVPSEKAPDKPHVAVQPLLKQEAADGAGHTGKTMAEPKQPSKPTPQPERKLEAKTAPQPAPVVQNAPAPVIIKQSGGKGLAVGALVLALLGLGASGFLFVQGQNLLKNQELSFAQKLDKAALGESENALVLKDAIHRQTLIQAEMQRLGTGQTTNAEQIKLTQRAYQDLVKGRANWLVDEAESMLNLASQQLLLAGNVQGAIGVLEHIQSRLSRFDQPELLPIKQAVSRDLTALKNRPYVDISGTALRIDRLEAAATGLPLLVDGTLTPSEREAAKQAAGRSWWENAWDKSLEALKGLVELRRLDSSDAMLIAPDQIYFVRENLRLRLLDARIALMQHNGEAYQSDLNNAEAAVKQYFDTRSPATQSWLKELAELKALDVRMVSDESLKASLTAVAIYQDGGRPQADIAAVAAQAASAPAITAPAVVPASAASAASAGTRAAAASSVAVPSEKPKAAASAPARPAAAPKKPVQQAPRPAAQPPRAPQSQESQIDPQFRKPQVPQIQQIQPSPVQPQAPGVERVIIRGDEE